MTADAGRLRFLPWLRRGLGADVAGAAAGDSRPSAPVSLVVRRGAGTETVTKTLRLQGPGDVTGLAPGQVIASDPPPLASDFEPNHLVTVSLDAPELPWLFSPDPAPPATDPAARVRPWLCLVVVRRAVASLVTDRRLPVAILRLTEAAGELPDLAESWAWAHAQIAGTAAPLGEVLAGPPQRTLARLICPRRLQPGTAYIACIVPAFAAGRQAGLGEAVTAGGEPAWPTPVAGPLDLPAYHAFEFSTGPEGDVETLVRRLEPRALGPDVGLRPLDVSVPGAGIPAAAGDALLGLEGALRSPATRPTPWQAAAREPFQAALRAQLAPAEPAVAPPLYGAVHAGAAGVATADMPPAWLAELNLDPRHRAAAALGAQVVRDQQEQLMAAAWAQAGELVRANELLRNAQLGRAVTESLREKRLAQMPARTLLRVTEPLHARIATRSRAVESLHGTIRHSVFPAAAVSPAFRRSLRPRGGVGRRAGKDVPGMVGALAAGSLRMPIADTIAGAVEFDRVGDVRLAQATQGLPAAAGWRLVSDFRAALGEPSAAAARRPSAPEAEPAAGFAGPAALPIDVDLPVDVGEVAIARRLRLARINGRFRAAASALQEYLARSAGTAAATPAPPLPVDELMSAAIGRGGPLDAAATVSRGVLRQLPGAQRAPRSGPDPLAPVRAGIRFSQPMSEALRALSEQHLLPGAEGIPTDTVGLLEANPRFIEAFMVGLNHEFGRELAWRGLETDPRQTAFDQFWDARGRPAAAPGAAADIPPIADWGRERPLGGNATRVGGEGMLVLLVRGALLRRHPTMSVYAVRAASATAPGTEELLPEFRGTLGSDLTYLGFGLSVGEATGADGGQGWFFVLQQQVTEPRFGLDEPAAASVGGAPARWSDLDWGHVAADERGLAELRHVPIGGPALNPRLRGLALEGATWGLDSAHMAQILMQRPVRVAVHARTMLGAGVLDQPGLAA